MMAITRIADFGRTGSVQLACQECGKPLDWVHWSDVVLMTARQCGPTYCFDCDGKTSSHIPDCMLIDGRMPDVYIVENGKGETEKFYVVGW